MTIELRAAIAVEEVALADTLAGLTAEEWRTPSLCAGWTVREVAAHLCLPYARSKLSVVAGIVRAGGRFDRAADRFARRDAERDTDEIVDLIRTNARSDHAPPGGGPEGRLLHTVVHALDIRRPLGLDHAVPAPAMAVVLDTAAGARSQRYFGHPFAGVALQATDIDWSHGSGPVRRGRAEDLALGLTGRPLADGVVADPAPPIDDRAA